MSFHYDCVYVPGRNRIWLVYIAVLTFISNQIMLLIAGTGRK